MNAGLVQFLSVKTEYFDKKLQQSLLMYQI